MLDEVGVELKIFKALSDKKRLRIMQILSTEKLTSKELLDRLDITQSDLLHHLKILGEACLVDSQREGKQIYYMVSQEGIRLCIRYLHKFE